MAASLVLFSIILFFFNNANVYLANKQFSIHNFTKQFGKFQQIFSRITMYVWPKVLELDVSNISIMQACVV